MVVVWVVVVAGRVVADSIAVAGAGSDANVRSGSPPEAALTVVVVDGMASVVVVVVVGSESGCMVDDAMTVSCIGRVAPASKGVVVDSMSCNKGSVFTGGAVGSW